MLKKFLAVAALAMFAQTSHAGLFGSAFQQVTNVKIQYSADGTAGSYVDAIVGFHFDTSGIDQFASTFVELDGVAASSNTGIVDSIDAASSYLGPGVGPTAAAGFAGGAAGTQPVGAAPSYAYADTDSDGSGGSLVDGFDGDLTPGAGARVVASSHIDSISGHESTAQNATSISSILSINTLLGGFYRVAGDYDLNLTVSSDLDPPGNGIAASRYIVGVEGVGAFNTFDDADTPDVLNQVVALGDAALDMSGAFATVGFELDANSQYDVALTGATQVNLIVPEPTTGLAFGVLVLCGGVARRRRRR